MESPVADHAAGTVIEIEHRGEGEIDAAGTQFGRKGKTDGTRGGDGSRSIAIPPLAQRAASPARG